MTRDAAPDPVAYGVKAVAKALGVTDRTVYRLIDAGEIRSTKIGRRRVIPVAALAEYRDHLNQAAS